MGGKGKRLSLAQTQQVTNALVAALNGVGAAVHALNGESATQQAPRRGPGRPPGTNKSGAAAAYSKTLTNAANVKSKGGTKNVEFKTKKGVPKQATNADLVKMVNDLRAEVADLKNELKSLKGERQSPTAKQSLRSINSAASDAKERERRSKNVIIRGIQPANGDSDNREHDEAQVEAFLQAVCPDVTAKKVQRLHVAKPKDGTDSSKRTPVPSLLVVLSDVDAQRQVLKAVRHHDCKDFKGVFAHEDRTEAQQLQYSECAKQAREKNEKLRVVGSLDQPFRYVVRGDRVRCIDSIESSQQKKSVYVTELLVKQHLDGLKHINNGISRQSVSTRSTKSSVTATTSATAQATQH